MIRRIRSLDHSTACFAAAVLAVLALQAALILRHAFFVDEWQALQIAVQSPDWVSLLESLHYEGHAPLWYALLRALAATVGPAHALSAASVLCAFSTIAIVAVRAPLAYWQRIAVLLGEPILFEYGTVSRGYSLCLMLAVAALALWRNRRLVWLPLALLPLVDFLGGLLAGGLSVLLASERGWRDLWAPGVVIFGATAVAGAITVLPAPDFVTVYRTLTPSQNAARWLRELSTVTLPLQWNGHPTWDVPWLSPLTYPLGATFFGLVFDQTRERPVERAVGLSFPIVLLLFMLAVHTLAIRHLLFAGLMLVGILWRQGEGGIRLRLPARLWLVAGAICGLGTAAYALGRPFDTAPEAAQAIRERHLEGETWLSYPVQHAQGVAALTGIGFEGLGHGCREEFVRWDFPHRIASARDLRAAIVNEAARGGSFYLLSQYDLLPGSPARKIAAIRGGLDGKEYYLFAVPGRLAGRRSLAAPCVEGLRPLPPLMPERIAGT